MTTKIYYFSGTGNSLYVAKELALGIPDSKLIPIVAILNKRLNSSMNRVKLEEKIKISAENIGFVFPCHGLATPYPVITFLKMIDIRSSKYLFAFATRGGTIFHGFKYINKFLAKQNRQLDATFVVNMGMNDPKLKEFDIPTKEELNLIELNVKHKIENSLKIIRNQEKYEDNVEGETFTRYKWINYLLEKLIIFALYHIAKGVKKYFYVDSKCIGCGICEKICLSNKIKMKDDKPYWQSDVDCYFCYGCLNFCPNEAIQIHSQFYMKSYTTEKGRYPHPYASVQDMIDQKLLKKS